MELKQGKLYYYGPNNDIVEIRKIEGRRVSYIQNKEERTENLDTVKSNIEMAGNREASSISKRLRTLNEKIEDSVVRDDAMLLEYKAVIKKAVPILFGKRYEFRVIEGVPSVVHVDSGLEFGFDPINILSHATKEILPWFNIHDFLYHFESDGDSVVLKIYDNVTNLQSLVIKGPSKNVCLLKGVVEANALYQQNITYNATLLNNIAKRIFKNKRLEEKKDYVLVVLDRYNEEYIEFNPLTKIEQTMEIVLKEIGNVFDYKIEMTNRDYVFSIFSREGEFILEEKSRDLKKLVCLVFESLLGG